ncbi:MAG: MFS transporter [Firmicutes bacterium]|nr:MFS transporter [Bacillota bacterium]
MTSDRKASETRATSRPYIMAGLMLTMGLAAMDATIVATAIPSIVRDLGGFSLFPWVFSVYLLVQAALVPIYGKLADVYGRKPMLLIGALIFLLGSVLSGLSWSMVSLIAFRGLQGVGAAAIIPIATTVVGDLFTIEERAKMQGYLSSVWGISAVIGPAIGGFLVQYASWRWVFYINVPIGIAALLVIWLFLHEQVTAHRHTIDYWGSIFLMISMAGIILGLLEGGVGWPWVSWQSGTAIGGGMVLIGAFIGIETRAPEPVIPLWVFGRRVLAIANIGSLVVGVLSIGLSSFLPTFVQGVLGRTPLVAGFALATMSIGWPLASAYSGKLYLKFGFRTTALMGAVLCTLSGAGFSGLSLHATAWMVAIMSFIMGSGLGLLSTSLIVAVQSLVEWNRRGVVTGSNMFARMVGSTLGVAVFGSMVNETLVHWFRHTPASIADKLPKGLNASSMIGRTSTAKVAPQALHYVQQGLYLGIHRVFLGLFFSGVAALLVEWVFPRKPAPLENLP